MNNFFRPLVSFSGAREKLGEEANYSSSRKEMAKNPPPAALYGKEHIEMSESRRNLPSNTRRARKLLLALVSLCENRVCAWGVIKSIQSCGFLDEAISGSKSVPNWPAFIETKNRNGFFFLRNPPANFFCSNFPLRRVSFLWQCNSPSPHSAKASDPLIDLVDDCD